MTLLASGRRTGYLLKVALPMLTSSSTLWDECGGGSVIDPALVQELVAARDVEHARGAHPSRARRARTDGRGRSNAGIGRRLWITEGTVEEHVHSILTKLRLPETDDDHRRVRAVVAFLDTHQTS